MDKWQPVTYLNRSVSVLLLLVSKDTCKLKHQIQRTLIRIIYLI